MQYLVPLQSVAITALLVLMAGCDLPFADRPTEVVVVEGPAKSRLGYVRCIELQATASLTFTVSTPDTGRHTETFHLRPATISGSIYPSHPGGFVSGSAPVGANDQLPFNRSCFIEDSTENAIGIRFRLTCGADIKGATEWNELIWITIARNTEIQLPHGATATAVFTTPGSQKGDR